MSAICGLLRLGDEPLQAEAFARMMRSMDRLGPDGRDTWQDARVMFGHQRMTIEPESRQEQQPLHDAESRLVVTADARLDNRDELWAALSLSHGEELTDSELLLKAYQHWGAQCFDRLVGEHAIALWDARRGLLYCATDPMGIRPLFYLESPGRYLAFASEVTALLNVGDTPLPVDRRRLAMLGVSGYSVFLEPERTCFQGVRRVPAGSVVTAGGRTTRTREYWAPDPGKRIRFRSDAECAEAFREVFGTAVRTRLRSVHPVASLLSGGLDSSAIVATAGRILAAGGRSLHSLSSVPQPDAEGKVTHEREFIDLFRDQSHLEVHYVSAPERGPFDRLEELVETASLCSYSYQHYLYTALVEAAREAGARIILDGDGGELSASTTPQGYLAELLRTGHWGVLGRELRALNGAVWPGIKRNILRPLIPYPLLRALKRSAAPPNMLPYPLRASFVADVLGREVDRVEAEVSALFAEGPDHRRNQAHQIQLRRIDLRQRSHAGFIGYDEARFTYPFMDRRVLEFCLAVDGRFKQRDGQSRRLLRLGMHGRLPETILSRRSKAPFAPDYHLRYLRARTRARNLLQTVSEDRNLADIIDFARVAEALEQPPVYQAQRPMRVDYRSQFLVPNTFYLCYFLKRYGS